MKKNGQSLAKIGVMITVCSIIGKILAFLKDVLLSYYYGSTGMTDAFFLAMSIPLLLLGVFTYSADSAIVPQYMRLSDLKDRKTADRNFSNIINHLCIIGILATTVILLFPDAVVSLFSPNFNDEQRKYAIPFLRIFAASGLFHIFYCFFSSYNTIYKHATARSILTFSTNLIMVIGLILYADAQMYVVAGTYILGSLIGAILPLITSIRLGYKHSPTVKTNDPDFIAFLKNFTPIMGSALLEDLNQFIDKFLASGMAEGTISALNYSSKLTRVFDSMLVVGIGIVIIPYFSKISLETEFSKFSDSVAKIVLSLSLVLLPITVLSMVFSQEIITIVYMRGSFTYESMLQVSDAFFFYAFQITSVSLIAVLSRIFYSKEDSRSPFVISAIGIGCNILLSVTLSRLMGMTGLALGTSLASLLTIILLLAKMHRTFGWSKKFFGFGHLCKLALSLGALGSVGWFVGSTMENAYARFFVGASAASLVYLLLIAVFFQSYVQTVINLIKKRLHR